MDKKIIEPTTGRRVLLFVASAGHGCLHIAAPFDAGIAYVHPDGSINVGYRDHLGAPCSLTNVVLEDRAQTESDSHSTGLDYAVWMPFQFQQALRAATKPPEPAQAPSPVMPMGKTGGGMGEPEGAPDVGQQDPVSGTGGTIEGAPTGPAGIGTLVSTGGSLTQASTGTGTA